MKYAIAVFVGIVAVLALLVIASAVVEFSR